MGTTTKAPTRSRSGLLSGLFTATQQRVLGVLFSDPGRTFYLTEVIRQAGTGSGAAQRELARLERSGLVTATRIGRQRHYRANGDSPLFEELLSIVRKTVGLADPLRVALAPVARRIDSAFVYGSVAAGADRAGSDVDLMVISDEVTYGDIFSALDAVGQRLGRTINPTVYSRHEWTSRLKAKNAFVARVLAQPKLWLIGTERDLPA